MEELIFFGIIILFSIIESISRSRKAKQKQESGEAEPDLFEWAQTPPREAEQQLPTYDADPSHDDEAEAGPQESEPSPPASAADVWAEIAGLASGSKERSGAARRPAPRQSPPLFEPPGEAARPARLPAPLTEGARLPTRRVATTPDAPHRVHLAHAGYGTDPSTRAPSEQDGLDPLARHLSADAAAVRKRLRSGDPSALRQAIILQELLGPPVTERD